MRGTLLAAVVAAVAADVYLHNPRGSNDRNCERNVNRNNGNRLFDSQNNAAGGYACPRAVGDASMQDEDGNKRFKGGFSQNKKMYFYEGSVVPIEWTNQHGCGQNSKTNCEILIQYMCSDTADPAVDDVWPYTTAKHAAKNVGRQAFLGANGARGAPRDGIPRDSADSATDTIPDTEEAAKADTEEERRFGMHESFGTYELCQHTERNKGLYTADQRLRRHDARGTRQNPNGNRRGLECPEERDYYPHWAPSPWIDVAVLTNDGADEPCDDPAECGTNRCRYYLARSQNRAAREFCDVPVGGDVTAKTTSTLWQQRKWPNNRQACEAAGFSWRSVRLADLFTPETAPGYPTCQRTQFARANHLGNAADAAVTSANDADGNVVHGVNANRFLWTVPTIPEPVDAEAYYPNPDPANFDSGMEHAYASCTLRIRYNITTSDFPAWPTEALDEGNAWAYAMVTAANNTILGREDAPGRPPVHQDPYVYVGPGDTIPADARSPTNTPANTGATTSYRADEQPKRDHFLALAVNTNQYGRTFQDRTYSFAIKKRPVRTRVVDLDADTPAIPDRVLEQRAAKIFNVNVRGKRGNIVQTFPSVEYDFVPNMLVLNVGDVVHFQWTGSDYNPRRGCNDGEGGPPDPNDFTTAANAAQNSRADRTNVVLMNSMAENIPTDLAGYESAAIDALTSLDRNVLALGAVLHKMPCAADADSDAERRACWALLRRLALLNQQSDGGAFELRNGAPCLTEDDLDAIRNKNERENHPLNCAKLNGKPYPYFDAGFLVARRPGTYAYYSSRNNNFSNRDQTAVICVRAADGSGCEGPAVAPGVLQDANPMIDATSVAALARAKAERSICNDEASNYGAANAEGAASCITAAAAMAGNILTAATVATQNKDNDNNGDGQAAQCDVLAEILPGSTSKKTVETVRLAIILFFVGLFLAWAAYFSYNRYAAYRDEHVQFKGGLDWKKKKPDEFM